MKSTSVPAAVCWHTPTANSAPGLLSPCRRVLLRRWHLWQEMVSTVTLCPELDRKEIKNKSRKTHREKNYTGARCTNKAGTVMYMQAYTHTITSTLPQGVWQHDVCWLAAWFHLWHWKRCCDVYVNYHGVSGSNWDEDEHCTFMNGIWKQLSEQ